MIYRPKLSFRDIIDYLRTSKARVTAAPVRVHRISQQQAVLDNTVPSWGRPKSVIWGRVTLPTPMPKFEWNARTNRFPSYAQRRIDIRKREERERERSFQRTWPRVYISRVYIRAIERMNIVSPLRPHSTCFPVHHRSSRSPHPVPKNFLTSCFW